MQREKLAQVCHIFDMIHYLVHFHACHVLDNEKVF